MTQAGCEGRVLVGIVRCSGLAVAVIAPAHDLAITTQPTCVEPPRGDDREAKVAGRGGITLSKVVLSGRAAAARTPAVYFVICLAHGTIVVPPRSHRRVRSAIRRRELTR